MELEVVNVASVEFTKKIQRERTRKHHLDEKLQRVKQQIQSRQRELLHSRKKVPKGANGHGGVQQLEKRLQALRTKYSVATTGNMKLKDRVDHLRIQKENSGKLHAAKCRELKYASAAHETLKKALFGKQIGTHTLIGQLDALKMSTLEDIHLSTGKFEDVAEMALRPEPRRTPRVPTRAIKDQLEDEKSLAAAGSVDRSQLDNCQKDLLLSQYMVHEKATELQKLIDDHVAVKLAMETMHGLRDECGLVDDAQVIDEFEATEEANYTECKMVNTLLREEAMLVKEQSILLDVAKAAATGKRRKKAPRLSDDDDGSDAEREREFSPSKEAVERSRADAAARAAARARSGTDASQPPLTSQDASYAAEDAALAEIEAKRNEHEAASRQIEESIASVQPIIATLTQTLTQNKTGKKDAKEEYYTHATVMDALSQIEDRVDLIVRMTSIAARCEDGEGSPVGSRGGQGAGLGTGLLPSLATTKLSSTRAFTTKAATAAAAAGDAAQEKDCKSGKPARRASVARFSALKPPVPGSKQPFFWPPAPTAESDDEDNVDRPFSLKQLRTKAHKSEKTGDVREAFEHEKHAKLPPNLHPDLQGLGLEGLVSPHTLQTI